MAFKRNLPGFIAFLVLILVVPGTAQKSSESYDFAAALFDKGLYERAIPAWRSYLKLNPRGKQAERARFHLAESLFQTDDFGDAEKEFRKFLNARPTALVREGRMRLGEILFKSEKWQSAQSEFRQVMNKKGDEVFVAAAYLCAECALKQNDTKTASDLFKSVLQSPKNAAYLASAQLALGYIEFDGKKLDTASRWFQKAASADSDPEVVAEAHFMLGEAFLGLNRLKESDQAFQNALKTSTTLFHGDAWIGRARIRARAGQSESAALCIKNAVAQGAQEKAARAMIREAALLHEKKKTQEGLAILALVPAGVESVASDLKYWQGVLASEGGDAKAGLDALREAVKKGATPNRRYRLADALMRAGEYEEAIPHFQSLDREGVEDSLRRESRFSMAYCHSQSKRHAEAVRILVTLENKNTPFGLRDDAMFARAENLFAMQQYRNARTSYVIVARRSKDEGIRLRATYKAGWCAFRSEEYAKALADFRRVEDMNADAEMTAESAHLAARCLDKLGRTGEAMAAHERVVSLHGSGKQKSRSLFVLAEEFRVNQEFEKALETYTRLESSTDDSETLALALFGKASALAGLEREADAVDAFESYVKRYPKGSRIEDVRVGLGWSYYKLGRLDAGRRVCAESLSDPVLDGERLFVAGLIERKDGKHKRAAAFLVPLAEMNPPHVRTKEAMLLAGLSLAKAGSGESAAQWLEKFASIKDAGADGSVALYELAFVLIDLKRGADANRIFARLMREHSKSRYASDAAFRLGERLYKSEDYLNAEKSYLFCVQNSDDGDISSKSLYKAAWCAMKLEKMRDAAKRFEQAASNGGSLEAESLFQAAHCHYELKDFEQSVRGFSALREKHRNHELCTQAGQRMLTAMHKLNRHREVVRLAGSILDPKAEDAWSLDAWAGLADSARALKIWGTAIRAYKHVAEKGARRDAARARYMNAECVLASVGKEAAVDAYLKVSIFHDDKEWASRALAKAASLLEELARPSEARKIWSEIIKNYPAQPAAKLAKTRLNKLAKKEKKS